MSLFDARANLFDEATAQQAVPTYKPVQKSRIIESIDPTMLEMAETVATEHFYQSASAPGSVETAGAIEAALESTVSASTSVPSEYSSRPDIDLSAARPVGSQRTKDYPAYQPNQNIAPDLEFERTMATESALGASGVDRLAGTARETPHRDDITEVADAHLLTPESVALDSVPSDQAEREQLAAEEIKLLKRRAAGDRERRALAIEPTRQLSEDHKRQIDELKTRNKVSGQPVIDGRDVGRTPENRSPESRSQERVQNRTGGAEEYDFIPDDVLKKSPVYRDDGRREEMRFESDTPQFSTALNDGRHSNDSNRVPVHSRDDRRDAYSREKPYANEAPKQRHEPRERYNVSESSAQEMRRYQQHRPVVEVSHIEETKAVRAKKTKRSGLSPWLLTCALIAAVCIALYAARDVIANMSLPEPLIASFCQMTGCVPAEPQKDTSQLQTMRKRLYPHPDIDNALVISVDLVNSSVYKQPYPAVAVTLLNADGGAVAERRFESTDYEVVDRSNSGYLMPQEPTRITIEVVDTGLDATDVELGFE